MAARAQGSQQDTGLVVSGGRMVCPNCEIPRSLHRFQRLQQVPKYAMETNPVYVCPKSDGGCGHVFSPGDHTLLLQALAPPARRSHVTNGHMSEEAGR